MAQRKKVPRKIQDQVLGEFNHRCAICGTDRPHLHHIDENPENNEIFNLLPLCPNCHLRDQHNPTVKFDRDKVKLFRRFKDPSILTPQFDPLFGRLQFLDQIDENTSYENLLNAAKDLVSFIASLAMGNYYSNAISQLLKVTSTGYAGVLGDDAGYKKHLAEVADEYRDQLCAVKDRVYVLVVELLRYQEWSVKAQGHPTTEPKF